MLVTVDQVEKLIIQNEAELNTDRKINNLRFLSCLGMATMVVILLLICCCLHKKFKLLRSFLDDDCCGGICICQTVISQREVKSSDENVTDSLASRLAVTVCNGFQLLQVLR
jgi:hypothetical protein